MEAFIAAAGTMLLVIGVTAALLQLFSAYALQTISEKNELPDFAQLLAWIPLLQIYPLVKCGGGDFKRFMLAIAGIVGGGVLLGILAAVLGDGAIVTVSACSSSPSSTATSPSTTAGAAPTRPDSPSAPCWPSGP